ncbi:MAG TPA: hypothetical protein IAC28_08430 [Candidatus Aphodovivens excrementavium]|nr:hypothetical protein [Candidatus Aphodovivens excrementavium]
MKIAIGANLLIGDSGTLDMPVEVFAKWSESKIDGLVASLDKAQELGAEAFVILGGLFGDGFVPVGLMSEALEELASHDVRALYHPRCNEAGGADFLSLCGSSFKSVLPHRDDASAESPFILGKGLSYGLMGEGDDPSAALDDRKVAFAASMDDDGVCVTARCADGVCSFDLGNMEPQGFSDPYPSGFLLMSLDEGGQADARWINRAEHPFVIRRVDVSGMANLKEIIPVYTDAVCDIGTESCVRVEFVGRAPLNLSFNVRELEQRLRKRFFYAEVTNESEVELGGFASDSAASLLAEFERVVLSDGELSDTEKARILRCGWGVLNGREIVE